MMQGGIVVLSPHYDDAVFSCGAFMAGHPGCVVLTVFAGVPPVGQRAPDWDQRCGFQCPNAAMKARHRENQRALDCLRAEGVQMALFDQQYGLRRNGLTAALATQLEELQPEMVLLPLGLFHDDHVRVSNSALRACAALGYMSIAYEDALYRRKPGLVQRRLAGLAARGVAATPWMSLAANLPIKARAVGAYASQLRALGLTPGRGDDAMPEHYWRLTTQTGGPIG